MQELVGEHKESQCIDYFKFPYYNKEITASTSTNQDSMQLLQTTIKYRPQNAVTFDI